MLEGLLGRTFSSKCKSLIKITRTRLDAIRRKRNAMLKYLKKDVADLLSNGLDINAYGRAEGLYNELNLSSCYDYVEQYCELIPKHLSAMQKQRECPEECREAISSLMFAAARFADLPELRDLRDTFTERFERTLEPFVNKELAENLASKPPSVEKKLQLMRDIAQEFSIKWDSKAFQQKMVTPSPTQDQPKRYGFTNVPKIDEKKLYNRASESTHKRNNLDVPSNGGRVVSDDRHIPQGNKEETTHGKDKPMVLSNGRHDNGDRLHSVGKESVTKIDNRDVMSRGRREHADDRYRQQKVSYETISERDDGYADKLKPRKEKEHIPWKREKHDVLRQQEYTDDWLKPERGTDDTNSRDNSYCGRREHADDRYRQQKVRDETVAERDDGYTDRLKPRKEKEHIPRKTEKHDVLRQQEYTDDGLKPERGTDDTNSRRDNLDDNSYRGRRSHNKVCEVHNGSDDIVRRREKQDVSSSHREHESSATRNLKTDAKAESPFAVDNQRTPDNLSKLTDRSSKGSETTRKPLPPPPYLKPNTPRNTAFESNLPPADKEKLERNQIGLGHDDERIVGTPRVNGHDNQDAEKKPKPKSVRRRHMRPPPPRSHDDEGDETAVRRHPSSRKREDARQGLQHVLDGDRSSKDEEERMMDKLLMHYSKKPTAFEPRDVKEGVDGGEPLHRHRRKYLNAEPVPPPSRATSLPPDPTETERVPARANSFQPDMYNAGGHVHPRLPDYDDFVARLASLRGR